MTDTGDPLTDLLATRAPAGELGELVSSASFRRPSSVFDSAWVEHAPFAFWLVDVLRPRTLVELGVWTGFSFLTFCDAVAASGLDTRCIGIDTWEGDAHAGVLSPDVADIVAARADRYGDRAELVCASFDAAAPRFPPHSVDLLHLDGLHTYEAVRHDVDTWLGRLSERGVLVLHDSAVMDRGFEVRRVVEELRVKHPVFTFTHGHGLAVVGVGSDLPTSLARLLSLDERSQDARAVREAYARLGGTLGEEVRTTASLRQLTHSLSDRERIALIAKAREAEIDAARAARFSRTLPRVEKRLGEVASAPVPAARWLRRQATRTVRVAWWTVTLQLPRQLAERRARESLAVRPVDDYTRWLTSHDTLTRDDVQGMERLVERLPARPTVSVLMPVCDPPPEALREAVESVLAQAYPHWELCLADDASEDTAVRRALDELSTADRRIRVVHRGRRGGISAASNAALSSAGGELCTLLDHDGILRPHALLLMAQAFVEHPRLALAYSDEDRIGEDGRRFDPFFKPDWSPALLESQNYVGRLAVVRTDLVRGVGAFRPEYDGAQDWDLILRVTEELEPEQIGHVPHVLYHRRAHGGSAAWPASAKRFTAQACRRAVVEHLVRRGRIGAVTEGDPWPRVRVVPREPAPHVSVIVPTTARPELLDPLLDGLRHTRYPAMDVVLAIRRAALDDAQTATTVERAVTDSGVNVYLHDIDPFNFARVNNEAVREAVGSYVLFLNDDIELIDADWLETLVGQAQGDRVAAVGALLTYPDRRIQHAGVALSRMGPSHSYAGRPIGFDGYFGRLQAAHDVSASTAACLLVRRSAFDEVEGFDPRFAVAYNDIDLCLRLRERGHRIVLAPLARLVHAESASFGSHFVGRVDEWNAELALIRERWGSLLGADVFHNPNLADDPVHPERLAFPPRVVYPWRVDPAPSRRVRSAIAGGDSA